MQINITINIDEKIVSKLKKVFCRRNVLIAIPIIAITSSLVVYGASITKPHTFASNDVISSSEMNDNFDTLYTQVNTLSSMHDAVSVSNSSNISIPNFTLTPIPFNTEKFDTNDLHDVTTNTTRLTAKKAGIYQITGAAHFELLNAGYRELQIRRNGTEYIASQRMDYTACSVQNLPLNIATLYKLDVDDYVELMAAHNYGTAMNIIAGWSSTPVFMMIRISD